jgi:hypothetical protein
MRATWQAVPHGASAVLKATSQQSWVLLKVFTLARNLRICGRYTAQSLVDQTISQKRKSK